METIKWAVNEMPKTDDSQLQVMSLENVAKARAFHESFPQYSVTPLAKLDHMAAYLGLKEVYVKDESYRFGLNAFKVLGGSFAMARYIAKQTGKDVSELPYNVLTSDELRNEFGQATFFTATDGNHGRGVAWAANKLGQKSVVLMPKGSTQTRLNNILKEGAKATIEEENYDECVRMANAMAEKTENGVMVQDTAWDGYEEIPAWIMQGYGTMANELMISFTKLDVSVRHMYLFRLVLVHSPEQFRDSSLTAIRKIHRKLLLLKLSLLHVFTKEHVLRTELSAS